MFPCGRGFKSTPKRSSRKETKVTLTKIQLEECKQAINDYIADEFGEDSISDFSDLTSIGLAYTTLTDDEIDIQVSLDLENLKLKTYIGDVDCSLESLVEEIDITYDEIVSGFDFDSLISGWENYIENHPEKYNNK